MNPDGDTHCQDRGSTAPHRRRLASNRTSVSLAAVSVLRVAPAQAGGTLGEVASKLSCHRFRPVVGVAGAAFDRIDPLAGGVGPAPSLEGLAAGLDTERLVEAVHDRHDGAAGLDDSRCRGRVQQAFELAWAAAVSMRARSGRCSGR